MASSTYHCADADAKSSTLFVSGGSLDLEISLGGNVATPSTVFGVLGVTVSREVSILYFQTIVTRNRLAFT
jgi:hypothetical protein